MLEETIFPEGFIVKGPGPNAPDFVKGKISIKVGEFSKFCANHANDGWINLDLLVSKSGKPYAKLNTWKKDGSAGGGQKSGGFDEGRYMPDVPDGDGDCPF